MINVGQLSQSTKHVNANHKLLVQTTVTVGTREHSYYRISAKQPLAQAT